MGKQEVNGTIFYASKDARQKRLYEQGRTIKTSNYHRIVYVSKNFVQLDLDSTGTNYVHVTLKEDK